MAYLMGNGLGPLLLRSISGSGIVRLAAVLASFAVGVELARGLGAAGYGSYGLALAVITVAEIPAEMGLPKLVTREVAAAAACKRLANIFGVLHWADSLAVRISLVMAAAIIGGAWVLQQLQVSGLAWPLVLGAPMIVLLPLGRIRCGALQGVNLIVRGQIPDILMRPLFFSIFILAALAARLPLSAVSAIALNSLSAAAAFVVAHAWLRRALPPKPAYISQRGREWLASAIPIGLTDGMRVLQSELSIVVLGIIAAPTDVGLFRIACVTSFAAATPVAIITYVALPIIARLYSEQDMGRLQMALTRLAQAQFAGVVLLCIPLLIAPVPLLEMVFGVEYGAAANALRILAAAQIFTSGFGASSALLNMTHHERRVTRAMGFALGLNLVALPILATFWGPVGAAVAFGMAVAVWNLMTWGSAWRLLKLDTSILPNRWTVLSRRSSAAGSAPEVDA